jgi:hypothetical protein
MPQGDTKAQTIDFQDGVTGNAIGSFYLARGVFFDNGQWDPLFGSPTNTVISTISTFPCNGPYCPTPQAPIVITFMAPVSSVRIDGVDVGMNGVRIDAYDAPVGGTLVGFQEEFGIGDGEEVIIPLTVSAPVIRRIALYQPRYTAGDGVVFDNLAFTPGYTATVLQSFDRLFQGDDPSEVFEFTLPLDPAMPSSVRFAGFVENRDTFAETGVRFNLAWGRTAGGFDSGILFPDGPEYLMGVRMPPADPLSGPIRVPVEFQASVGYWPASVILAVEGLGCCDNFRFVGNLTIEPLPRLAISRLGSDAVQITWTTNSAGYRLESAETLTAPVWIPATNSVSVANGNFSVTGDTTAPRRVYRLRKP